MIADSVILTVYLAVAALGLLAAIGVVAYSQAREREGERGLPDPLFGDTLDGSDIISGALAAAMWPVALVVGAVWAAYRGLVRLLRIRVRAGLAARRQAADRQREREAAEAQSRELLDQIIAATGDPHERHQLRIVRDGLR
jgi:hypothetical protein